MKSVRKNRRKRETLSNLIMKRKDTKKKKNTKKRKKNKMNRTRKKNKKRKKRKNRTISQKGGLVESVPSLSGTSILQTIGLPWWVTWSHVGGTAMSGLIIAGIAGVVYLLRNQIFAGAKAGAKAVKEGTKAATEKLKEGIKIQIPLFDAEGIIIQAPNSNGQITVEYNGKKLRL